jgi:hypothetical protein
MCRSRTNRRSGLIAAAAVIGLGAWLAGCSDAYLDRRDTIALSAGDAIAANEAEQMVDPWPRYSGDKNIAFNGQKMQSAVERYRTNKVFPPQSATSSTVDESLATSATQNTSSTSSSTTTTSSTAITPTQ